MRRAFCLIRHQPHYRHDAFVAGLRRLGFDIYADVRPDIEPDDVLVIWNRYGRFHDAACAFEKAGAQVLVAENGYIGSDEQGRQLYAIARNHHNGAGSWHVGEWPRWDLHNIDLMPWRIGGKEIVILPQRGIGPPGVAMPAGWADKAMNAIRALTDRPIRVRRHPGTGYAVPLAEDLKNAHAVVTWGSGAAIKALVMGIPAFYELDDWIGAPAARYGLEDVKPRHGDREKMLHRIGWAQWTVEEIERGEPFALLLREYG